MVAKWWILLSVVAGLAALPGNGGASRTEALAPQQARVQDSIDEAVPLASGRANGNRVVFEDSAGDAPAGADISTVVVSSDDLGNLTFEVSFASGLPTELDVVVYLDSDRNEGSGAPSQLGADYVARLSVLEVTADTVGYEYTFSRWEGARFRLVRTGSSSGPPRPPNALTFTLDSDDLGGTSGFNFIVTTENQAALARLDRAPDQTQSVWAFDLRRQPVRLSVVRFVTKPKTPRAGGTFTVTMTITASSPVDLFSALDGVSCRAKVGRRALAERDVGVSGGTNLDGSIDVTPCSWRIPSRTHGKLLQGSVTLTFNGIPVTRRFSARIAR